MTTDAFDLTGWEYIEGYGTASIWGKGIDRVLLDKDKRLITRYKSKGKGE